MALALIAVAETAQDVAEALNKFLRPVEDQSEEITALIAECYSTSSALHRLANTIEEDLTNPKNAEISADLSKVRQSLEFTFRDVQRIFGGLARVGIIPGAEYIGVWRELCRFFKDESGNSLCRRLDLCKQFLVDLSVILTEG